MKKFLPILGGIAIAGISTTSVVSCIAPQYAVGPEGGKVMLSSAGGKVDDHSFNEDARLGIKNFGEEMYDMNTSRNYVEAQDSSYTSIVSGYKLSHYKKADAVVLPGFTHMVAMPAAAQIFKDKTIVLIDGVAPEISTTGDYKNVISVLFNSQIAGLQAGFDAAYWATTKDEKTKKMIGDANGDGHITIGTFAGATNKYGVDNYMWGMLLGVSLFNQLDKLQAFGERRTDDNGIRIAKAKDQKLENVTYDPDWWTNSFGLNDSIKKGITPALIDNEKCDIIFPVAGPQIEDVLGYEPKVKGAAKPYVIGVDVDQSKAYANYKDRFITSATKNVHSATVEALKRSSSLAKANKAAGEPNPINWDGTSPNAFYNWSIDLLDSKNQLGEWNNDNKLKRHKMIISPGENGPDADKEGAVEVPKDEPTLINYVNEFFANEVGPISQDYMNGDVITKFARDIIWKFGTDKGMETPAVAGADVPPLKETDLSTDKLQKNLFYNDKYIDR
ncbi:BMP family ABC transporter substrate-binding protein [Mesoplasma lactucae]|uniref:Uncharacterized protein n=1 Tax=Mesoplasma lactucae ATCC 49193 TaxID=81460 RepID=A0A291ISF7_9MOLU|nr:BMP family ABC transporter substrate-binding protein [Mesoplasma lactucae]ATG97631.1 hypothetical protein CP520_02710 [Mesoplasma lactucae ATCC 49193]ATZ19908.1 ribose/galactose ABC transporter substrate-binding protein [Mesoplasma lactucae ATCC 49193]MCL8216772.1 hypothetical protein [Mesoplasma lactucae ATCC 49193]